MATPARGIPLSTKALSTRKRTRSALPEAKLDSVIASKEQGKSTAPPGQEITVPIASDRDIVTARQHGRTLAGQLGYSSTDATLIATVISELARNIVLYAKRGEVVLSNVNDGPKRGIIVLARDEGPGIADLSRALSAGYSTSGGLGLGLPGVRWLMDEFEISSEPGKGTTVTIKRWKR